MAKEDKILTVKKLRPHLVGKSDSKIRIKIGNRYFPLDSGNIETIKCFTDSAGHPSIILELLDKNIELKD